MSTVTPPVVLPAEDAALNARYLALVQHYDACAVRYKRWMLLLWNASMLLTWVPLLLAIPALPRGVWLSEQFYRLLVNTIMPCAGLTNALLTIVQLVFLFRSRWLKYRAATERLRENCMRFRARLHVFSDQDAAKHFQTALDELEKEVNDRRPFRLWDHIPWSYLVGLRPLPEKLRDRLDQAPNEGLYPRCDDPETAETIVIFKRLRNQQRWHLLKARRYSRIYLLLQVEVVLLGLASPLYRVLTHPDVRDLVPLALFATATLCLIAYRERLGYAALCVRYTRIVDTLEQIEREYEALKKEKAASPAQHLEWLRQTAARVERSLASEFQYWYFGRENFGNATSY
jgi:hypothetical protein